MCDCYWVKCEVCKKGLIPVHIADFCMSRDDIKIYCRDHVPSKDVVVHKIIEDEYRYPEGTSFKKTKRIEHRAGWRMGVRYIKNPPPEYGYTAITPNVGQEHIAKAITKSKKSYWATEWTKGKHNAEVNAVKETIKRISWLSPAQQVWRRYLLRIRGR